MVTTEVCCRTVPCGNQGHVKLQHAWDCSEKLHRFVLEGGCRRFSRVTGSWINPEEEANACDAMLPKDRDKNL